LNLRRCEHSLNFLTALSGICSTLPLEHTLLLDRHVDKSLRSQQQVLPRQIEHDEQFCYHLELRHLLTKA
jgi:hypothetical protein